MFNKYENENSTKLKFIRWWDRQLIFFMNPEEKSIVHATVKHGNFFYLNGLLVNHINSLIQHSII